MTDLLLRSLRRLGLLRRVVLYPRRYSCGRSFRIPVYLGIGAAALEERDQWAGPVLQVLLMRCPGAFVDCGVNLGATLLKVHVISPDTPYLGFEANPACVAYVDELMAVNGITGPVVVPLALSDHRGAAMLEIYHHDPTDATASSVPDFKQGQEISKRISVPCMRFDEVAPELLKGPIGVVRLDLEGADQQALEGMVEHVRRDHPVLILRFPPVYRESNTERLHRQLRSEQVLSQLGYALFRIHLQMESIRLERLNGPIGIHAELDWSDHIAVHRDREAHVLGGFLVTPDQR